MKAIFRLVLALTLTSTALHAQVPQENGQKRDDDHSFYAGQMYTMHHNVALVILDGVAIDGKGNPVTDLKKEDFTIMEDGKPQITRNFEAAGKYTPSPDVTIDSTADLAKFAPRAPVNIVLLDEFTTRFEDMAFARYSLKKWLERQPAKLDTPTILIAVSLDKFEVLRDYTQSKDELLSSLEHHFAAYPWHMNQVGWTPELYSNAHLALRRVAEATASHQGPKTMIWIGRGFPSNRAFHQSSELRDSTTIHTLRELRDSRVVLYTIDPAGILIDPQGAYPTPYWADAAFGGDPRFQALAAATGGRTFANRNDVDVAIANSIRDGSSVYTLTYIPTNPDYDRKKIRHVVVNVNRPGVTFVTRKGYDTDAIQQRTDSDGNMGNRLQLELASALQSNMKYDAMGFTVSSSATDPLALHVHIPSHSLTFLHPSDETKPNHARFEVVAASFDKNGKGLKQDLKIFDLKDPRTDTSVGVRPSADVDLLVPADSKATHLRVVVREDFSGHIGTVDLPLTPGSHGASNVREEKADDKTTPSVSVKPEAPAPGN